MAFAAMRSNCSGAYRLWVLAKALDIHGSGVIKTEIIKGWATSLGIHLRSYYRWLNEAKELSLFKEIHRRSGTALIYKSAKHLAEIIGCEGVESRYTLMPAMNLFSKGWQSNIWVAHLLSYSRIFVQKKGNSYVLKIITQPISRRALEEITGVPKSTQIRYEKLAGVEPYACYAESDIEGINIDVVQEIFDKPHAFISTYTGLVCWQLPNRYHLPNNIAVIGGRGRSKKLNKYLNIIRDAKADSSLTGRVLSQGVKRIFFDDWKQAESALQKRENTDIGEAYAAKKPWKPKWSRFCPETNTLMYSVLLTDAEIYP